MEKSNKQHEFFDQPEIFNSNVDTTNEENIEDEFFINTDMFKSDLDIEKKLKYRIMFIDGAFGDGKTLFLTNWAVYNQNKYDMIYANYHLKGIDNFQFLPKVNKKVIFSLKPYSLLLLHEGYHYADKRRCMKKENITTTQALFQIRKRHIDIVMDIRRLVYLDFRWVDCGTHFFRAKGEYFEDQFLYEIMRLNNQFRGYTDFSPISQFYIEMKDIYPYYDHEEIVTEDFYDENEDDLIIE